ncbi:MAG: hypothetical protein K8T91_14430 [Planctomycetes bacterium]|nr:hypothetical protein [Planctomycetota bacterium]
MILDHPFSCVFLRIVGIDFLHLRGRARRFGRKNGALFYFDCAGIILVGHLQVVLGRDFGAVADPLADDVHREGIGQLCLPRRPQILKELRPGRQTGPFDDPLKLAT